LLSDATATATQAHLMSERSEPAIGTVIALPQDAAMRMISQVSSMFEDFKEIKRISRSAQFQMVEHERRIMGLERHMGVRRMNQPVVITKLVVYAVILVAILYFDMRGNISHDQTIADVTVLSSVLIAALGLKGAADSVSGAIMQFLSAKRQQDGASTKDGTQ
jgi:hypothetical protein